MLRRLIKNKDLIFVGLLEIVVGISILFKYNQYISHLPPTLDWTDDFLPGLFYLFIGIAVILSSIWDFYWYYIRLVLITLSGAMFILLSTSYAVDGQIGHHVTLYPYIYGLVFLFILAIAYQQPGYKLRGGNKDGKTLT